MKKFLRKKIREIKNLPSPDVSYVTKGPPVEQFSSFLVLEFFLLGVLLILLILLLLFVILLLLLFAIGKGKIINWGLYSIQPLLAEYSGILENQRKKITISSFFCVKILPKKRNPYFGYLPDPSL